MFRRRTPSIPGPQAIATLEPVMIGGVPQWLMVRGHDRRRPVLLFLHGGPGGSQIGWARPDQAELERHFVVVNWDQRGAGLSFSPQVPRETMRLSRLVEDVGEVVAWLSERLGHYKVILVGHSWGSMLGMLAVQRYPERFHAFVGVSQVVAYAENERVSYEQTLERSRAMGHRRAVRELTAVGAPPFSAKGDRVHHAWLERLGGFTRRPEQMREVLARVVRGPEYTLADLVRFVRGQVFSLEALTPELRQLDLQERVPSVQVPVHFCCGRHDLAAPPQLAERYLARLEAPRKHWQWFEQSAHAAPTEEAAAFSRYLVERVAEDAMASGASSRP